MAHKAFINGTVWEEICGGKAFVEGTVRNISKGKAFVEGAVHEIPFVNWPNDLNTGLEFISSSAFTISVAFPNWNGTMEYCNGDGWKSWDGSEISSGETQSGHCIYLRGTGNTTVSAGTNNRAWVLTGDNIMCNGNIEKLLDYATVSAGEHPSMGVACFGYMFYNNAALTSAPELPALTLSEDCYYNMFNTCINLVDAPSLPATTLAPFCYYHMFNQCWSLTSIPKLPATELANYCYSYMFTNCSKIKLSSTSTDTYTQAYRIPYSGTGTTADNALISMFGSTGGTFTDTPDINTTYYLDASIKIV